MTEMLFRSQKRSPDEAGARCPHCHAELPVVREQQLRLVDGHPVWLFCARCERVIQAEMVTLEPTHAS